MSKQHSSYRRIRLSHVVLITFLWAIVAIPNITYSQEAAPTAPATEGSEETAPKPESVSATSPESPETKIPEAEVPDSAAVSGTVSVPVVEEKKGESADTKEYWTGSLMYKKDSMELIYAGFKSYKEQIPLDVLLPSLFAVTKIPDISVKGLEAETKKKEETITSKDFFLNSIVYFSPDNWITWLNGEKLQSGQTHEFLKVAAIDQEKVTFLWQNAPLSTLSPNWKKQLAPVGDGSGYFTNSQHNIVVNEGDGNFSFILRPNQTFSSSNMEIIEGKEGAVATSSADVLDGVITMDGKAPNGKTTPAPGPSSEKAPSSSGFSMNPMGAIESVAKSVQQLDFLRSILEKNTGK